MATVLGIDLGTTNSCAATISHGQARVLESAEGGRTTPSVVAFLADDEVIAGISAKRQAVANPGRTLFSIKRFMGRKFTETSSEQGTVPYTLTSGENDAVRVLIGEEPYAPEHISALILSKLKRDAEEQLGQAIEDVVITVPAYFNNAQREATTDAASIAGLNVLRIINEPTAAALAYGFSQEEDKEEVVLVFDLGGGTFDVSILETGDSVYEVKATHGDSQLGGNDFDKAIVDWLADEFRSRTAIDVTADPAALQRLVEAAEKAKIELSSTPETHISLPFLTADAEGPKHLDTILTRSRLGELCAPLLARLAPPVQGALEEAKRKGVDSIDHVLLVGGMTRMPAIQEVVEQITGLAPLRSVNPDEAVAMGAALQAGALSGEVEELLLLDVVPIAFGIETKGGIFTPLIEANTTVPARAEEIFTTSEDNQPSVEVHILQGQRKMASDNRSLERLVLLGIPPAPAGVPQIVVTFNVNADGILAVSARDLTTGQRREAVIHGSTGLSAEEIERMRSEAQEFADSDRALREAAEIRNRTEFLRSQARALLRSHGDRMERAEREAIEGAIEDLDGILAQDETDFAALQEAYRTLTETVGSFSEKLYSGEAIPVAESSAPEPDAPSELPPA
jgi:molecular chaperone DnaK